ncbi:hypothetical protein M0R45_002355 [Rubus argutus]|uniref:Uncharacterized protein n=1 Tax=Rubus argutus TaxID=59490 RepID=A0AAW1VIG9_RUBAR
MSPLLYLIFFQNGMLEPWLESKDLGDADQVLAYFAVSKPGEPPVDGITDTNPEGLTASYGKRKNTSLRFPASLQSLLPQQQQRWGLVFEGAMADRLCAYPRAVSHFPTAFKEFKWRNELKVL